MEHSQTSSVSRFHLDYVGQHINQTMLVYELLKRQILFWDDIEGWYPNDCDEYPEIYQWLYFPNFLSYDFEKLVAAKIPVLDSDYGSWVGITSFGSHYDLYVYPELIETLFGIKCTHEDLDKLRYARWSG